MAGDLADITLTADGAPARVPAAIASNLRLTVEALAEASGSRQLSELDGAALPVERAELSGWKSRATVSAGLSCRLLECADGWLAVNLARPDDWRSLDAWLLAAGPWNWRRVESTVSEKPARGLVERASLLGLAVAAVGKFEEPPATWTPPGTERRAGRPRVLDLSSLWAGPLAGRLLRLAGAQVTKAESSGRPDGARFGDPRFYRLLNEGKTERSVDLSSAAGRSTLRRLIEEADIVIESSRPRAMKQLGIDIDELLRRRPGLTWVSITGYGRSGPDAGRVAFGDDAAAAAGLCRLMGKLNDSGPIFCGDAVADPITGASAALAAWSSWAQGGGLVEISLRDTTAQLIA